MAELRTAQADNAKRIAELESENDELLEAWSNQAKTIYEQIMRIRELESLVRDMWRDYCWATDDLEDTDYTKSKLRERIAALGIEVD